MPVDPRNAFHVSDSSSSMNSANVMHTAFGLSLLGSEISGMPFVITFSGVPTVIHLRGDIFDNFIQLAQSPWGMSTNIDATYRIVLDIMREKNLTDTLFAMVFYTDGQFNSMSDVPLTEFTSGHSETFLDRMTKAFKGFILPRIVFWNLNATSPGYPSAGNSTGVQLVSGYSQNIMRQVLGANVVIDTTTGKASVDPWTTLLTTITREYYDPILKTLIETREGCFSTLS